MIKATDKWFRLLKGIPLNEQKVDAAYFCDDLKNHGKLVPGSPSIVCKDGEPTPAPKGASAAAEKEAKPAAEKPAVDEKILKKLMARGARCNRAGFKGFGHENAGDVKAALKNAGAEVSEGNKYDAETLKAVISFQKAKGLKIDGCVGPNTGKALGIKAAAPERPAEDITGEGKAEVPIASWYGKITPSKGSRELSSITSIVLHDTLTSLGGMIGAFSKPRTYTSKRTGKQSTYYTGTHFSIDKSGNIRQHAPLNRGTNHTATGGWNKKSVGIDMVTRAGGVGAGYIGFEPPTAAQLSALYDLVNQLKSKIPSINDTIHWIDEEEKNNSGWQLGGKQYSPSDGIVSHGMVQGNRADATISSYYLKLRSDGMSHNEAFQKAIEDEQQARTRYANSGKGAAKMKSLQRLAKGKGRKARRARRKLAMNTKTIGTGIA
jgi:peptidoglycan hydrolase-like protein with peptidoglycan-binding domain